MKIVTVEKKINEVVNRLEKTKEERYPDLAAEKESRDREERNEKKAQIQEQKKKEKEEMKKKKEMEELRCCMLLRCWDADLNLITNNFYAFCLLIFEKYTDFLYYNLYYLHNYIC